MSHRFVRCPHCKMPHDAAERVCPTTGRRIEPTSGGHRSRMSELPPPERKPEPLGFDAARNRFTAEREAAERAERAAALQRPVTGTSLQPTRNLQQDLIGRTVGDRYIVKDVLGEGGMGTVYEAEHIGLGRQVAIKVLNPSQAKKRVAVKRFQQEARAAGAIGHPNICEVYDLGSLDDGSPYLVMEKLIGTTLADRISREGGLPFDEIADVMMQVLAGLIAAHDKGIVHRDIKPENIFLARRVGCPPIVKILDFGVSKMMPQFQGGDEQLDLTRTGMVMGTPYYMSPEQARGERNLDGRVDVYACGVMMYESIVGKRPFLAPNYNALLLSIINTTPKALRDIRPATPPGMEQIVQRSMAKARDDRYPSANAVLRDIQGLALNGPVAGNRMPAPPTAEERLRAPVLGGRSAPREHGRERSEEADRSTRGGRRPADENGGAGATLRSRMADAQPPSRDNATRLDIKLKDAPRRQPSSDSVEVDIPIHITGSDLIPVQEPQRQQPPPQQQHRRPAVYREYVEEMPTEIFRPGMHPHPPPTPMAPRSPSATRVAPAPQRRVTPPLHQPVQHLPVQVHVQQHQPQQQHAPMQQQQPMAQRPPSPRPAAGQPPPPPGQLPPAQMAPVDFSGLTGDDWDGETVVKKPAALTTSRHRDRSPSQPQKPVQPPPQQHVFNPDQTVNMGNQNQNQNQNPNQNEIDVDFSDETQMLRQPPPRRR